MDKKEKQPEGAEDSALLVQKRVPITKVVIDTPALLNMIKHCHNGVSGGSSNNASGQINGVLRTELGENNIFISSVVPDGNKTQVKTIKKIIEDDTDNQKQTESNADIGFYVSCELGLVFTGQNLLRMISAFRDFKNSFMIAYDVNKAAYGLNPLACYRLSEPTIEALSLNNIASLTNNLMQDKIREQGLTLENFFEEVPLKIHRSHLLQAFLFDHIQPHLPSFNNQLFQLASTPHLFTHQLYRASEHNQTLLTKVEAQHKKMAHLSKKYIKKLSNKEKKSGISEKEEKEALEHLKAAETDDSKTELFLFSKQVDTLCNQIYEFDNCFPNLQESAEAH